MKFLIVLPFFLALGSCVVDLKTYFNHGATPHKDCASHAHHGAHSDKIAQLNKGEHIDGSDHFYQQHLLCIWKEKGLMSEDGVLQKDVILDRVAKVAGSDAEAKKKAENCIVQKATPAETAVHFYNCMAPLIKEHNSS